MTFRVFNSHTIEQPINTRKLKTNKHLTIAFLLLLSVITTQAQKEVVENSESVIIMSEDDIISLVKTLKEHKKRNSNSRSYRTVEKSLIQTDDVGKNTFEVKYLKSQIVQLERQLEQFSNAKTTSNPSSANDLNSLNRRELNNIKHEISQLRNLIQQIAIQTNRDPTVVVPSTQLTATTELPMVPSVREQLTYNEQENLALENKLDSINILFQNLKPSSNSIDYSGDFNALEKRIEDLKKELLLKNSEPNTYDVLSKKYKGFSSVIYFSNNSIILNLEAKKVVDDLYEILNRNDNVHIVVKGFASNKGNALYNENLSMQRTESVKKAMMLRGIHPTRVLTQYHGIDYNAGADNARRVEISILVRK